MYTFCLLKKYSRLFQMEANSELSLPNELVHNLPQAETRTWWPVVVNRSNIPAIKLCEKPMIHVEKFCGKVYGSIRPQSKIAWALLIEIMLRFKCIVSAEQIP